jgi:hypothetical protein
MRLYAVYRPPAPSPAGADAEAPLDAQALRDLVLVREGFDWLAFFFAPFHAIGCGAWTGALGAIALLTVAVGVPEIVGLDPLSRALAVLGYAVLCGVSAHDVRRLSLEARGFRLEDVVAGSDRGHALIRFAERHAAAPARPQASPPKPSAVGLDLGPSPGFWS